jgi:hypothetical protein
MKLTVSGTDIVPSRSRPRTSARVLALLSKVSVILLSISGQMPGWHLRLDHDLFLPSLCTHFATGQCI